MSEWVEWHRRYDGESSLARRLRVVQGLIGDALDARPTRDIRVVSMCAGDGRDLLGVLASHARRNDVRARLVELDAELVARGRAAAAQQGLTSVEFVNADASYTDVYDGAVPADLVLVCGVFGNISDEDIHCTIDHLSELCTANATVIWTRGRREGHDLTPTIRQWLHLAGFGELAFTPVADSSACVGAHRLTAPPRPFSKGVKLFAFLPKEDRPSQRWNRP